MAIILGLATAICYGCGDFFGGVTAKRLSVLYVVGFSHLIGLIGVAILAPFVADAFAWRDLGLGAIAGVMGGVGVVLLYRGLARGPMAVVAPLTAITSAATPAAWGVLDGETLSRWSWLGVICALIAIALTSLPSNMSADLANVEPRVVLESLLAGACFGAMFIVYDTTTDASAPWPVVGARLVTTGVLLTVIFSARRSELDMVPANLWPLVLTGVFDAASNAIFLWATSLGDFIIVAVLSSLYPISTVLLARIVLDERISRLQLAGLCSALLGTALIAIG